MTDSHCAICNQPHANDTKDGIPINKKCWYDLVDKEGVEKALETVRNNNRK